MNIKTKYHVLLFLLLRSGYYIIAQPTDRCGTSKVLDPSFEKWVKTKIEWKNTVSKFLKTTETVYKIPIVVHILHQGEPIGVGTNLSEEQILSQMAILNQDYRRLNPDASKTPALFQGVAADTYIEFELAKQDPYGAPTNGIVRVRNPRQGWFFQEGPILKQVSYWPAENYLNIWITPIENAVLGFADLPVSDKVGGLEESVDSRIEGVVIDYRFWGIGGSAKQGTSGRTATHEIGHYLGLRHIWGDPPSGKSGCDYDDFCNDTPRASDPHFDCPVNPINSCSGNTPMYQNYMDYTGDKCMNLFTSDQKTRMRIILENSPRRKNLLTSFALSAPLITQNDAAIISMSQPGNFICKNEVYPKIVVRNMGASSLNALTITCLVNDQPAFDFKSVLSLEAYEFAEIDCPLLKLNNGPGPYKLKMVLKNPNDAQDERVSNDTMTFIVRLCQEGILPLVEKFNSMPSAWNAIPITSTGWDIKEEQGNGVNNKALFLDLTTKKQGQLNALLTPYINLENVAEPSLSFKYAYTYKASTTNPGDKLLILVSGDCGSNFSDPIFVRSGSGLETANATDMPFIPSKATEWKTVCIDLSPFKEINHFRVAFVAIGGGGGNALYIDDVELQKIISVGCLKPTHVEIPVEPLVTLADDIDVYPNPADDHLYIKLNKYISEKIDITVYTSLGKEIFNQYIIINAPIAELPISEWASGVYFIKVIVPGKKSIIKSFIKK